MFNEYFKRVATYRHKVDMYTLISDMIDYLIQRDDDMGNKHKSLPEECIRFKMGRQTGHTHTINRFIRDRSDVVVMLPRIARVASQSPPAGESSEASEAITLRYRVAAQFDDLPMDSRRGLDILETPYGKSIEDVRKAAAANTPTILIIDGAWPYYVENGDIDNLVSRASDKYGINGIELVVVIG